jgi:DNA-binding GntR family transcriptional regulator
MKGLDANAGGCWLAYGWLARQAGFCYGLGPSHPRLSLMNAKTLKRSGNSTVSKAESRTVRPSNTEMAYQEIRRQILENEMPPGFQITEQELALSLGVSRTPAREALLRLEAEGLVEIWPRHGMRVKRVSIDDVREIYEILTALESAAAGLAAIRKPAPAELSEMRDCTEMMDKALRKNNLKAWAMADEKFHRALTRASGNARFVEMVDTYFGQSHRLRMMTLSLRPKPSGSNRDHEAVLKAIEKGDPEAAERVHRDHRVRSAKMMIALLTKHGLCSL